MVPPNDNKRTDPEVGSLFLLKTTEAPSMTAGLQLDSHSGSFKSILKSK